MWDQGKQTVKSSLVLPHQQLHTIISLSYFTDTEIPSRWEKLVINDDTLTTRMQTPDQLNLKLDDVNFYSPRHPPIGRMSVDWSCPLWIITVNLLTIFPMLGHMVLRAWHIALCLPLPGKAMKLSFPLHPELCHTWFWGHDTFHCVSICLAKQWSCPFHFTQNFVSEIWLGTAVQRSWTFNIKYHDIVQTALKRRSWARVNTVKTYFIQYYCNRGFSKTELNSQYSKDSWGFTAPTSRVKRVSGWKIAKKHTANLGDSC